MEQLKTIQQINPIVKEIRGRGLMLAIELKTDNLIDRITSKMLEKGYFIGCVPSFNVLRFSLALNISIEDIREMCEALRETLEEMRA